MARLACLYVDLDGTLLGAGSSLFTDADGAFTMLGARALEACARAGAEVVVVTGRGRSSAQRDARMLGGRSLIAECGGFMLLDGEEHWLTGSMVRDPDRRSVFDQIDASGAPALLLGHYEGRLRYHAPWHLGREVAHLFCGEVDAAEGQALLATAGHDQLRLVDNGAAGAGGRILLLLPAGVSKATAVEAHRRARGYDRRACIAVGDSPEDAGMAAAVGAFWLVANGEAETGDGVRRCEQAHGAGVYEAVVATLAGV